MATVAGARPPASFDWHVAPVLRQHALIGYFVLALGLSWLVLVVLGGLAHLPEGFVVLGFTLGPTVAAVIMTVVVDGQSGLRKLLRRVVQWRVGLTWYLIALVAIPGSIFLMTLVLPGALASFAPMSPVRWLVTYVIMFVLGGIAGEPLFEEIGWRGFALPRLQARMGPLGGTFILGGLWALWHLPQYLVLPGWTEQNGGRGAHDDRRLHRLDPGARTDHDMAVQPHGRQRPPAILAHSSVNTGQQLVVLLFPSAASTLMNVMFAFVAVALVLIVVTRGRLGYQGAPVTASAANPC